MNSKEAAKYLGVAPTTLATWRQKRTGPVCIKIGRSYCYALHHLQTWQQHYTVRHGPAPLNRLRLNTSVTEATRTGLERMAIDRGMTLGECVDWMYGEVTNE